MPRVSKRGKGRRPKRNRASNNGLSMRGIRPSQISSNPRMRHKFRFGAGSSGAGTYNITNNDILLASGGLCTVTNSTITAIFASFRVIFVEAWAMAGAAPATVSINWNGTPVFVSNGEVSDTSVSPAYPAHIMARPPRESNAAFWQTASTGTLFVLVVPNDTVIDVMLDLVMSDNQDVDTVTGVTTASLGTEYFLALDGAASNQLVPQSLNTTH
jgi:hypothetical protein